MPVGKEPVSKLFSRNTCASFGRESRLLGIVPEKKLLPICNQFRLSIFPILEGRVPFNLFE